MSRRSEMLELAILGLLHDAPMHGYELRKQLNLVMGTVRALSYGTLYPRLRDMVRQGWIVEAESVAASPRGARTSRSGRSSARALGGSRRTRITYELTADGKDRFGDLLDQAGPAAWEDGVFDVHFAFFARTNPDVRLRILEGRRSRLEERLARIRELDAASNARRRDSYAAELRRHSIESAEREVHWLVELIEAERSRAATQPSDDNPNHSSTET